VIFDFDNTIFVHLVLLVIMYVTFHRFIARPWLDLRDRRESLSVIKIQRAEKLFETAKELQSRCDTIIDEVKRESVNRRHQARLKAVMAADERRARADREAVARFEASERDINAHAAKVRRAMPETVEPLAGSLAERMLGRNR